MDDALLRFVSPAENAEIVKMISSREINGAQAKNILTILIATKLRYYTALLIAISCSSRGSHAPSAPASSTAR